MWPQNAAIRRLLLSTKSWQTLALPGLITGVGEMGEISSVLHAHLVTCIFSGFAVKGFHAATKSFKLLKENEVFKYLVLFLLWHPCDLH